MRLATILSVFVLIPTARADDIIFPSGMPASQNGGLMIIRQGGTTTWSLGGGLVPRQLKVVTATPEGPVVARFKLPSLAQARAMPFLPDRPAGISVEVPDNCSAVYVEGELVPGRGKVRLLESQPLAAGQPCAVRVRIASILGDKLVIEEKVIVLRSGQSASVIFDSSTAQVVPLEKIGVLPPPQQVK